MKNWKIIFNTLILLPLSVMSQWSHDPAVNTNLIDTTGWNILPKVATCANGDSYISWFSAIGDFNFHVLMQKYDKNGYRKWTNDLVVSANPTMTWVSDYNMIVDDEGNAVLVNQDLRSGSNNVYAWKISPAGEFLWGDNGITITQDTNMLNLSPKVVKTPVGDFVVMWDKYPPDTTGLVKPVIGLQRISKNGDLLWGNGVFISDTMYNYLADILATEDTSIIVAWDKSQYYGKDTTFGVRHYLHIYAQKYDMNGNPVWPGIIQVDTGNNLEVENYIRPYLENDKNGGVFILWKSLYPFSVTELIQHLDANGNAIWPGYGREVSDLTDNSHSDGGMVYMPATGELYVAWAEYHYDAANLSDCWGIYGQKFSAQGERLWGDAGKAIIPLNCSPDTVYLLPVVKKAAANDIAVFYQKEFLQINYPDTAIINQIYATRVNSQGNYVWNNQVTLVSNSTFDEENVYVGDSSQNQWIVSWSYWRDNNTRSGISAQNVSMDGRLGPLAVQEPAGLMNDADFSIYPNPFQQFATIRYQLAEPSNISISLYDSRGLFIKRISKGNESCGEHFIIFNRNDYSPGMYMLKMETNRTIFYLKIILL